MASILESLFGTPSRIEQVQRFTPQQQSVLNQILGQAQAGLQPQNFGAGFDPIAKQARTQFQTQTVPGLAERFTALGNGAQRSSAFQGALGSAGAGLEENLAAQKANFGLQQNSQLQNLLSMGLTPQFDSVQHQREPGLVESGIQGALQLLMAYLSGGGSLFGGMGQPGGNQGSSFNLSSNAGFTRPSGYGSGFANPALYGSGMQNLMGRF